MRRSTADLPLISRSAANRASIRCTASRRSGRSARRAPRGSSCARLPPHWRTRKICASRGRSSPLPGSVQDRALACRARRSRYRHQPEGCRSTRRDVPADARRAGRVNNGTAPPAAPGRRTGHRRRKPTSARIGLALGEDRHRRVVAVQALRGEDVRLEPAVERHQRRRRRADLVVRADRLSGTPSGAKRSAWRLSG
jgi:hypothetical protein